MRPKILLAALAAVIVAAIFLAAQPVWAAKSYSAERYDVDVVVLDDGSLRITETFVFRFLGGPFTNVYRTIPNDETDGIGEIVASMDGRRLREGNGPGQIEITYKRNETRLHWRFEQTSDSAHTFVLSYRLFGVVRQEDGADLLLYWPLPTDHDYPIASSVATISYPSAAQLLTPPTVDKGPATVEARPGQMIVRSGSLGRDDSFRVALRFSPGSVIAAPPAWQARAAEQRRYAPALLGLAAAIVLVGAGWFASVWSGRRRNIQTPVVGELSIMRPPSDLPPALAGMLNEGAADPQWPHGMGALLDLARRGMLTIEEAAGRSLFRQRDFVITLLQQSTALRPHEDALLRLLFESKGVMQTSVKMSDLSGKMGGWDRVSKPLQQEMRAAGLFDAAREGVRRRLGVATAVVFVAGLAGFVLGIPLLGILGGWVMAVPLALCTVSLVGLIAYYSFSVQSGAGVMQQPRWQAFARYLKGVAKGQRAFVGAQLLEEYLPYAAAFGMAEDWAKLFKQRGEAEVFAWFRPLATASDRGAVAFVAMIAASSSAGSSAGGAGAGGAGAGGGSSGAS